MTAPNSPSGIYKCSNCGHKETHVEGNNFAPCSECETNNWILHQETDPS